jgi:hypothetical protein
MLIAKTSLLTPGDAALKHRGYIVVGQPTCGSDIAAAVLAAIAAADGEGELG